HIVRAFGTENASPWADASQIRLIERGAGFPGGGTDRANTVPPPPPARTVLLGERTVRVSFCLPPSACVPGFQ
ncbi:MAG: hypothetical protein DRJ61_11480, partial [Acidobacteria bacterium]